MKTGIYKITNKLNDKMYIGSSKHIEKRWKEHKRDLNKGCHHSIKLQRAWDKYGEENFEFEVLEECEADKRLYLEQYYIDKNKVFYEGYNCKEKTREMYSETDYHKEKEYSPYSNIILKAYNSYMDFSDKKTVKRVINYGFKNNEHIWYVDIIFFVDKILEEYNYLYIKNEEKEDNNGFIDFDIKNGFLYFSVAIKEYNSIFNFKYCLLKRSIILTTCETIQNKKVTIFDKITNYNNQKCEYLLGKIFYFYNSDDGMQVRVKCYKNSEEYFQMFMRSINPFNVKKLYDNYFSESNPNFLNDIYKYVEDNNVILSHMSAI